MTAMGNTLKVTKMWRWEMGRWGGVGEGSLPLTAVSGPWSLLCDKSHRTGLADKKPVF